LQPCPNCHSHKVKRTEGKVEEEAPLKKEVSKTTKQNWKQFHSTGAASACPNCGGTDFTRDYKHKERVCKKCGTILSLPRN
jgi:uncharacterized protein (DUF983 family)